MAMISACDGEPITRHGSTEPHASHVLLTTLPQCTQDHLRAPKISSFSHLYQTLMPQVRFLDSTKRAQYGPRGF
jgi:hypothetical protein